jgi:hypothetical protein
MFRFRRNSNLKKYITGISGEPYHKINLILAGVIVMVMAYSGIFSPDKNDYPVVCIHEKLTGQPCVSCGLSHSFSLIIRGRISEAYDWNPNGMRVFLFFLAQLIFRIDFLRLSFKRPDFRRQLIIYDSIGSGAIFLISFWPFIVNILKGII